METRYGAGTQSYLDLHRRGLRWYVTTDIDSAQSCKGKGSKYPQLLSDPVRMFRSDEMRHNHEAQMYKYERFDVLPSLEQHFGHAFHCIQAYRLPNVPGISTWLQKREQPIERGSRAP